MYGDDERKNDDENADNCNKHTSTDAKGKQNCTARIVLKIVIKVMNDYTVDEEDKWSL